MLTVTSVPPSERGAIAVTTLRESNLAADERNKAPGEGELDSVNERKWAVRSNEGAYVSRVCRAAGAIALQF